MLAVRGLRSEPQWSGGHGRSGGRGHSQATGRTRSARMERNTDEHRRRRRGARLVSLLFAAVAAPLLFVTLVSGGQPVTGAAIHTPAAGEPHRVAIVLARERRDLTPPLSLLDVPPPDEGVAGARLAINDNTTTGRFLNQEFTLEVVE